MINRPGAFAERLASGGPAVYGTTIKLPAIETVELLAHAAFDFVVIDLEHAPITLDAAYRAIVVAQAMGMGALVRVPDHTGTQVPALLDAGADGILVPRVSDAATAKAAMEAMRFAPDGHRSLESTSRAGVWGLDRSGYQFRAETHVVRGVQVEDQGGLAAVEGIVAVDGLNALFIGTGDLARTSGQPADDPINEELVAEAIATARAAGVPCGTAVAEGPAARAAAKRGFSFVVVSNDVTMFAIAARDLRLAIDF